MRSKFITLAIALAATIGGVSAAHAAEEGFLFVKSKPDGATIWLDGQPTEWKTPRVIRGVAAGEHVILLKLAGHTTARSTVEVKAGKIRTINLTLGGQAVAENGSLSITSTPAGATVWVDEVERGKTPVVVSDLKTGDHLIIAMIEGYELIEQRTTVAPGEQTLPLTFKKEGDAPAVVVERDPAPVVVEPPPLPTETAPVTTEPEKAEKTIDADCPYCKGVGKLKTMGCYRCDRTGRFGYRECTTCKGRSELDMACKMCNGKGTVFSRGREYSCKSCKGKGYPSCPFCKGDGKVKKANPAAASYPTSRCVSCAGTGFEQRENCLMCKGRGNRSDSYWGAYMGKCKLCGGDGKGPPVCTRCKGKGGVGQSICRSCAGTGHTHRACKTCRGRGFTRSR